MNIAEHIGYLEADGPRLAAAAHEAGWDALVPATEWTVRDLLTHVGGIHRWAADIVRRAEPGPETPAGDAVGTGPPDGELLDWFADGHAELVSTLRSAPDDLDCFAFLPAPSPLAFWARRQAHETAIHRADAQGAAGVGPDFDAAFAADGVEEFLTGFAARKRKALDRTSTIVLRPTDGGVPWRVTLGGERIIAVQDADADADAAAAAAAAEGADESEATVTDADSTIAGTCSALYLWLWNRPADVAITGEESVAELWKDVRVRWS